LPCSRAQPNDLAHQRQGSPRAVLTADAQRGKALSWRDAKLAAFHSCGGQKKEARETRASIDSMNFDFASVQGVATGLDLALIRLDLHQLAEGCRHLILDQLGCLLAEIALGFPPQVSLGA